MQTQRQGGARARRWRWTAWEQCADDLQSGGGAAGDFSSDAIMIQRCLIVCYTSSSSVLQQPPAPLTLISKLALLATMAVLRPCGLCPLPCRSDRAPFRLYPAGNKQGKYSHDSCIKAEKKRVAAAAALAQPDTDAGASGAAVASVVKKQKTDAAGADARASAKDSKSADEDSCMQAASLLSGAAACPAVTSPPSSNAADAAHLLFALHIRYVFTALL